MGWSLKREKMTEFLENIKTPGENFRCMLWGTIYTNPLNFQNRSVASIAMSMTGTPGVVGSLSGGFCYIGLTDQSLYVVAVDSYNTSIVTGNFAIPFADMKFLKMRVALFGVSRTVEVTSDVLYMSLTVKGVTLGTDIYDQKERMWEFWQTMESLRDRLPA